MHLELGTINGMRFKENFALNGLLFVGLNLLPLQFIDAVKWDGMGCSSVSDLLYLAEARKLERIERENKRKQELYFPIDLKKIELSIHNKEYIVYFEELIKRKSSESFKSKLSAYKDRVSNVKEFEPSFSKENEKKLALNSTSNEMDAEMNYFDLLPDEIIIYIFPYLDANSQRKMSQVSLRAQALSKDECIRKQMLQKLAILAQNFDAMSEEFFTLLHFLKSIGDPSALTIISNLKA